MAQNGKVFDLKQQAAARQNEITAITADQARLRENMKALKGSPEEKALLQRYTRQLDGQEDRLSTLHKEIADLATQTTAANAELENMISQINFDQAY